MADIALGGVERIFKAGFAIKKAVQTARRNKEECRDIERSVARIEALLLFLNQMMAEALKHPAINGPLVDLAESMEKALELIEDCEGRHPVRRLLGAGGMARELRRVHEDILRKLTLGNFATNVLSVHVTITLTHTVRYGIPHPPSMQLQDAVEMVNSYSSHLTTDDAISGFNSEITMVTTSSEVPNDPSSRLTEFNLPKLETTMHDVSEESISGGGGHSFVFKQKIVIKIQMTSDKSRSRAMALAAKVQGTSTIGIIGVEKDMLEVVGQGVDSIELLCSLHRYMGPAQLMKVEEVKDKEAQPVVVNTKEAQPVDKTANRQRSGPSGGFRPILTKLSKFMWPRARRSVSHPPPSPLHVEHTSNPAPPASGSPNDELAAGSTSTSTAIGPASPPAHDELAAVEAGCVLEDYVAMFDGPMPPAVIAALSGALFHVDDEGSTI